MYIYRCLDVSAWYTLTPVAGGRGWAPLMISAAFSASIMVGAFRLPLTTLGMIEASTTLSPSSPSTRHSESTTAMLSVLAPICVSNMGSSSHIKVETHLACAGGVVGAVTLPSDKLVNLLVSVDVRSRGELLPPVRIKGGLGEYLSGELDTLPHLVPGHGALEHIIS